LFGIFLSIKKDIKEITLFKNVNRFYILETHLLNLSSAQKALTTSDVYVFKEFYLELKNLVESSEKFCKKKFTLEIFINPDIL